LHKIRNEVKLKVLDLFSLTPGLSFPKQDT